MVPEFYNHFVLPDCALYYGDIVVNLLGLDERDTMKSVLVMFIFAGCCIVLFVNMVRIRGRRISIFGGLLSSTLEGQDTNGGGTTTFNKRLQTTTNPMFVRRIPTTTPLRTKSRNKKVGSARQRKSGGSRRSNDGCNSTTGPRRSKHRRVSSRGHTGGRDSGKSSGSERRRKSRSIDTTGVRTSSGGRNDVKAREIILSGIQPFATGGTVIIAADSISDKESIQSPILVSNGMFSRECPPADAAVPSLPSEQKKARTHAPTNARGSKSYAGNAPNHLAAAPLPRPQGVDASSGGGGGGCGGGELNRRLGEGEVPVPILASTAATRANGNAYIADTSEPKSIQKREHRVTSPSPSPQDRAPSPATIAPQVTGTHKAVLSYDSDCDRVRTDQDEKLEEQDRVHPPSERSAARSAERSSEGVGRSEEQTEHTMSRSVDVDELAGSSAPSGGSSGAADRSGPNDSNKTISSAGDAASRVPARVGARAGTNVAGPAAVQRGGPMAVGSMTNGGQAPLTIVRTSEAFSFRPVNVLSSSVSDYHTQPRAFCQVASGECLCCTRVDPQSLNVPNEMMFRL